MARCVAAVDLGAESGRVFLARFDGTTISLEEVHRFPNGPARVHGHLHWNVLTLWEGIVRGLRRAREMAGVLDGVGVDTWGVDYALVDARACLLGLPFHYRDGRTDGVMERVFARVPRDEIYRRTGIQFMPLNTLIQLVAQAEQGPEALHGADRLLMMPDLFHAWLSGERVGERTNASTTQCWSVPDGRWDSDLFNALGLPTRILPPVVEPGTRLGPLVFDLRDELGAAVTVVAPATHDTAAAVAAVPAQRSSSDAADWAYISSGTWSLVGLELRAPLTDPGALQANFTNEGGVFGTVRFLKNVMGLWLLQECRRAWETSGETITYDRLFALAGDSPRLNALINPDDPRFLAPRDMPSTIEGYLRDRGQSTSGDRDVLVRCIVESLVLRYRQVLESAAQLANRRLAIVHVVGGGARSRLMNQWLADATGWNVVAGPAEATALGNALMQLVAFGELSSLQDVRALASRAASLETFEPSAARRAMWDDAYDRFLRITEETTPSLQGD